MVLKSIETNRKREKGSLIYGLVLSVCLSVGCFGCLFSMFGVPVPFAAALLLTAGLPVIFTLLSRTRFPGRFTPVYALLLAAAFLLIFYREAADGFLQMINAGIARINETLGTGYLDYNASDVRSHIWMALIPVMAAVSAGIGYSCAWQKPFAGFFLTAALVLTGLFLKGRPSVWMLLLLTLSWTALFLAANGAGRTLILTGALALMCLISVLFTDSRWQPLGGIEAACERIIAAEEGFRFGGNKIDSLSEGDLTKTHPLNYDDRAVFSLQMQLGQSLYLRGFAGADYVDQRWKAADDTAYAGDYRGIGTYLSQQGYNTWCQMDALYRTQLGYTFTEVEIENVRASSKYIWLPYETAVTGDAKEDEVRYDQDRTPRAKGLRGQRKYTVRIFDSQLKDYDDEAGEQMLRVLAKQPGYEEYIEKESIYRRFAYDTYMDVDEESRELIAGLGADECRGKSLDYCLYKLRNSFSKEFTYDTDTKAAPKGRDELDYFLNESRQGNCMHFATAAVLFLREAGFPARYAEGYYLSPEQVSMYDELENVSMPIADSDSHAWAEIYADGLGWMPVEVTPGFYDMEKRKSNEKEETEELSDIEQQAYQEELPVDDEEPYSPLRKHSKLWKYILAGAAALLVLIYLIRRLLLLRRRDMVGVFRYLARVLRQDRIRIKEDPYRMADVISERYDGTGMTYDAAMQLMYRERFGAMPLDSGELNQLNMYSRKMARAVFKRVPWYRKLWMLFVAVVR